MILELTGWVALVWRLCLNSSLPSVQETTILARKSHPGVSRDHHHAGRSQGAYTIWGLPCFPSTCEHTESRTPRFTDEEVETDHTASPSTATERCLTWGGCSFQMMLKVFMSL